MDTIFNADMIFSVTRDIKTEHTRMWKMCTLSDGSVVVCVYEGNWMVVLYDIHGEEIGFTKLPKAADGLAEVRLRGIPCLAVSYM